MAGRKPVLIVCLFLAAATLVAFWQVTGSEFINFDDPAYVTANVQVQRGLTPSGVAWAFTTGYFYNWHPLTWLSHMLDVELFGLSPGRHHLTSLLFHIANTLLLFFFLLRSTGALGKSAAVAALFALHPLHVESVAWVAERKDVLSTFFWLLAMNAYYSYAVRPRLHAYLRVLVFFALGLMAKPMLVTFPFVLLLLDYWPLCRLSSPSLQPAPGPRPESPLTPGRRITKRAKRRAAKAPTGAETAAAIAPSMPVRSLVLEKLPFFALAAIASVIAYVTQERGGAVESLGVLPLGERVANAFVSYALYAVKTIWPSNLGVSYPHPGSWPLWQVLASVFLFVAVTGAAIRGARRFPYLASGWLWYAGTLVPVIGIVQIGMHARADRYTYIPLIGLFIIAAWGIPEITKTWRRAKEALFALSLSALLCLLAATWIQVGHWRDSITLYDHTLKATGPNPLILNNRGIAYNALGDHKRAIADLDRALEQGPGYADAYYNRGVVYSDLGDHARAIADFGRAIAADPRYKDAYNNRGMAYGMGGDYARAIGDFDHAIAIDPGFAKAYYNRGTARNSLGDYALAIGDFDHAIAIDPGFAGAYNSRGMAYGMGGDYARAIGDFDHAIAIDPGFAIAYYNRSIAYGMRGDRARALDDLKTAARLGHEVSRDLLRSQGTGW